MIITYRKAMLTMTVFLAGFQGLSSVVAQNPLDSYAFKNTHNSYEKDHPLNEQMDDYNVWCLELDLCCRRTDSTLWISVQHHGCYASEGTLTGFLSEMMFSSAWDKRITFLWLDIKHDAIPPCNYCNYWPHDPADAWTDLIKNDLDAVLPAGSVYTHNEFKNDSRLWPSLDDLLSQGKHFIVILDGGHWDTDKPDHPYFFVTATSKAEATSHGKPWIRVINREDGSLPSEESPVDGDGYLWRAYGLDETNFNTALNNGFNLLGVDDYGHSWTEQPGVHPPVPLRVDASHTGWERKWGTYGFPFSTVNAGVGRALPRMEVTIIGGYYNEQLTISKPLTLKAIDGAVTIGHTGGISLTNFGAIKICNSGELRIH
ncbi:MAG: hypothetical protein ACYTEQ_19805 [Planctomycetota bacterium]|jgi:hypothetical protein